MLDAVTITVALLVLLVAGLIQGAGGFGFALTALPVLCLMIPLKDASAMLVLTGLSINGFIFWRLRSHFSWERMLPIALGGLAGVPLGVLLLAKADARALQIVLGIVLLMAVGQNLAPGLRNRKWHPLWLGAPCGVFSGALTGAFGTGGPPAVAYVAAQGFDRFRYSASVQLAVGMGGLLRLPCLAVGGLLSWQILAMSAAGGVAAAVGAWVGLHVLKRLPEKALRYVVTAMLLVLAIKNLAG